MKSHVEIRIFRHTETQQSPVYIPIILGLPCIPKTTEQLMLKFDIGKLYEKS
jgi:hypothetical protein